MKHAPAIAGNSPLSASGNEAEPHVVDARSQLTLLKDVIREEGVLTTIERNKFVFQQGAQVDKTFLIEEGCVALTYLWPDGNTQILDFFFDGHIFTDLRKPGVAASFSAKSVVDSRIHVISNANLRRIVVARPELHFASVSLLVRMLRRAYENLNNMGCRHGEERVAFILCVIYRGMNNRANPGSTRWDNQIHIRQIDIANTIGVTAVYVNQIIKSLKDKGLIGTEKGSISIIDYEALKEICNFDMSFRT